MKLIEHPLLADENIDPTIIQYLRVKGFRVHGVIENGWAGLDDETLLNFAFLNDQVVVTHDSDFGTLAIADGKPYVGIIYLKPGHLDAAFTIQSIEALMEKIEVAKKPFIIVVQHGQYGTRIRYRQR